MAARAEIVETCTVTSKGQTTVPKAIRQALGVRPGDRIAFRAVGGQVTVERVGEGHADPAIGAFLHLIEADIAARRNLGGLPPAVLETLRDVLDGGDVDLDAPIDGDVSL